MIKIREYHFIWYLIAVSLSNIVMVRKTYWFLPFIIFGTVLNQSFSTIVKATILGKGIENHIDLKNLSIRYTTTNVHIWTQAKTQTHLWLRVIACTFARSQSVVTKGYLGFPHIRWNWLNRSNIWKKWGGSAFWNIMWEKVSLQSVLVLLSIQNWTLVISLICIQLQLLSKPILKIKVT